MRNIHSSCSSCRLDLLQSLQLTEVESIIAKKKKQKTCWIKTFLCMISTNFLRAVQWFITFGSGAQSMWEKLKLPKKILVLKFLHIELINAYSSSTDSNKLFGGYCRNSLLLIFHWHHITAVKLQTWPVTLTTNCTITVLICQCDQLRCLHDTSLSFRVRTIPVLGYWVLANTCQYWVVLVFA